METGTKYNLDIPKIGPDIFLHKITACLDKGNMAYLIYLDFGKLFDIVPPGKLLAKQDKIDRINKKWVRNWIKEW